MNSHNFNQPNHNDEIEYASSVANDLEMMYACPNCGKVATFKDHASTQCSACGSETLPQDIARCEINANSSYFTHVLNYSDIVKQNADFAFLSNRTLDLSILSTYTFGYKTHWLRYHSTVTDEVVEFTAQNIATQLEEQRKIANAILSIPNNYWFVSGNNESTRGTVFFSHPNGSFTALSLMKSRSYREEWYTVDIRRFDKAPSSLNELNAIFSAFTLSKSNLVSSGHETHLAEHKTEPIYHLRKPEYANLLKDLDNQQFAVYNLLTQKHTAIVSERAGVPILRDTPKVDRDTQIEINKKLYIDDKLSKGVAVACASCGSPISGYKDQVSFLRCPRCSYITDLVGSGRLSRELLDARKPSETFVPADYFLQLLTSAELSGGPKASRILELLTSKAQYLSQEEQLEFVNAISWIAIKHPYLMSYYRYKTRYEDYPSHNGGVFNIIFPDSSVVDNGNVMGGNQYLTFNVPPDLQGKILSITFGDFDDGGQKEPNEYWCRVKCSLFDSFDFDSRFAANVNSWGHQHVYGDERYKKTHWAEHFDKPIHSGFNKPTEGPIYNRIRIAMQKMPPKNFFLNSNS